MSKFDETVVNLKDGLKALLTKDAKSEEITKITELDKMVDSLVEGYKEQTSANDALKTDFLNYVKHSGFKSDNNPAEKDVDDKPKEVTFEECVAEVIKNRKKEEN